MNERIEKLAGEAGIAVWGDAVYMYNPKDTLDSTVLEKFAASIIQECAGVAEQERLYQTSDLIKKHFGVEV